MEQPGCIGYPQSMASQPSDLPAPNAGFTDRCRWFQSRAEVQTLECLRCGFVKQPVPASAANATSNRPRPARAPTLGEHL